MPDDLRPLLRIAAAIASREARHLEDALRAARETDARAVEETILQSHLFVGFPDALNALARWRESVPSTEKWFVDPGDDIRARGEVVCRTVYGTSYDRLRENVRALHPDLERWMLEHGYGRVIGRQGLSIAERELVNVALLAVWRAPRQLHSHLRGALNAGASERDVREALEIAAQTMSDEAAAEAWSLWRRVRAATPTEAVNG